MDLYSAGQAGMELLNIRSQIFRSGVFACLTDSEADLSDPDCIYSFLCALYLLIRRISEGVFLKKFIEYGSRLGQHNLPPYYTDYQHGHDREEIRWRKIKSQVAEIVFDYTPGPSEKKMNENSSRHNFKTSAMERILCIRAA